MPKSPIRGDSWPSQEHSGSGYHTLSLAVLPLALKTKNVFYQWHGKRRHSLDKAKRLSGLGDGDRGPGASDTNLQPPASAQGSCGQGARPWPEADLLAVNLYSCLPDAPSRNEITLPMATMNSPLPWERQGL